MSESKQGQNFLLYSEIVEENGKTIRENNMEKQHKYPVGTLVEVKFSEWHGNGSSEKGLARLWVVEQTRDCDGTPLYSLSHYRPECLLEGKETKTRQQIYWPDADWNINPEHKLPGGLPGVMWNEEHSRRIIENWKTGFNEESLTPVEVTEKLKQGYGALKHTTPLSQKPYSPEMLCQSCGTEQTFEHVKEHQGERPDYCCTECGWYQTSPEGGYCEVLTTWMWDIDNLIAFKLAEDEKPIQRVDADLLGEYLWQTCQGEYGKHYAKETAKSLLKMLERLKVMPERGGLD